MAKYAWIEEEQGLAWTIAVTNGVLASNVVRAHGGDPDIRMGTRTFEQSAVPADEFGQYFCLRILAAPGFVAMTENNGWSGKVPEIARRVTRQGGRYFGVYWNRHGHAYVTEAQDGKITAYFEPLFADTRPGAGAIHPDWLSSDFDIEHYKAASLAAMEERTRISFDRFWLTLKAPTYRIPNPDVLLRDVPGARLP
ncbi:DUF6461 domain-containing protein [Labedaea rhizosphaerae]|uniref:DUF6461 domain-containing protein n=1 Tax=Labedaea rhizosphaerae TaxID=598644 RepID=UPI0010621BED|nr:DUF6461 domain-containing protein [Labedaea rhizosphaerae]